MQAWYFVIVNGKKGLDKISSFSPGLLGNPPNVVVIYSDKNKAFNKGGKLGSPTCKGMGI